MLIQPIYAMLAACTAWPADAPADTGADAISHPVLYGGATDNDGDGIPDDAETSGIMNLALLDFPAFGADPNVPDVFLQADWIGCDPLVEFCGMNNSLDYFQISSAVAADMASYYAPDVALHIDNGIDPIDPALATVHGDWGGARRLPPGRQECDPNALGTRYGYFHRGAFRGWNGGGSGQTGGYCFGADSGHGSVGAHELGHNLGLGHGGTPESYAVNCKPHYLSPMNYAYLYNNSVTAFSRLQTDLVLNPAAMDESLGLATGDPLVLDVLETWPWYLNVREDGAVDWNRDGRFDDQPVRAAATWGSSSCEQSHTHTDTFEYSVEPTLAWLPTAAPQPARLYTFSRGDADGLPYYRYATTLSDCEMFDKDQSCTDWQPAVGDDPAPIPDAPAGTSAVAAVGWRAQDSARLLVAYADDQGQLYTQSMHLHADTSSIWQPPVAVEGAVTGGSPALIIAPEGDRLLLIAPSESRLLSWEMMLDGSDDHFVGPVEQVWDDGTPILPCYGVALTRGYQADREDESIYALIPAGPFCRLEIARRTDEGAWVNLSASFYDGATPPIVGGRPGFAYTPISDDIRDGRFYIAYKYFPISAAVISMTEGNDLTADVTERRARLLSPIYMRNVWAQVSDGVSLLYDHRFDSNLRAIWTYEYGGTKFNPFADGIVDVEMRSVDDYEIIHAYLACSLTRSCS